MNLINKMDAIEAIRAAENSTPDDLKQKEAAAYRMGLRAAVAIVSNCRSVEALGEEQHEELRRLHELLEIREKKGKPDG